MNKTLLFSFWAGGALAFLLVVGLVFYNAAPSQLLATVVASQRFAAGLELHHVELDGAQMAYLDTQTDKPVVVLVHGIYAEKDHWNEMAAVLAPDFRVIVPDVPGFGESEMPLGGRYSYDEQAARLHTLLKAVGVTRYHLAGNSMGGTLVGLMAVQWPRSVLSVSFIGGVPRIPNALPSAMSTAIAAGEPVPMVVTSVEGYFDRFAYLFVEMPFIPGPILNLWAARDAGQATLNARIWGEVGNGHADDFIVQSKQVQAPALVLWCDGDAVFHVSGAWQLAKMLGGARTVILPGCGHLPMMERPEETGAALLNFLKVLGPDQSGN